MKVMQRSRSIRAKDHVPKWTGATTLSKDLVNCDLNPTKEVQHYKQTSAVKSLSEVKRDCRWTRPMPKR